MFNRRGNVLLVAIMIVGLIAASIGGYYLWSKYQTQKEESVDRGSQTKNIALPKEKEVSPSIETTNWKVYVDHKFNYSFKYPNSWYLKDASNASHCPWCLSLIILNDSPNVDLDSSKHKIDIFVSGKTLEESKKDLNYNDGSHKIVSQLHSTKLGALDVIKANSVYYDFDLGTNTFKESGRFYNILLANGNKVFGISANPVYQNLADQIFSTFKFLDQNSSDSTTNWKTYKNTAFGYEISYPGDWIFTEALSSFPPNTHTGVPVLNFGVFKNSEVQRTEFGEKDKYSPCMISVVLNLEKLNWEDWANKVFTPAAGGISLVKIVGDSQLDSVPAKKFSIFTFYAMFRSGIVAAIHNGQVYVYLEEIQPSSPGDGEPAEAVICRKMLSSFKFL